jgi:hypothetical protein
VGSKQFYIEVMERIMPNLYHWLPPIFGFYIMFRAVRRAILGILNKINQADLF